MAEHRCPGCGKPTGSSGTLCSACCTSGYSQYPAYSPSLEDPECLEQSEREVTPSSRPPTNEDLKRLGRVKRWKKEMTPSSKPNTNDSPTEVESQSPKKWKTKKTKTKKYTLSQVATAAGRAVAAVGADNLPLEAQREALELAKRWLLKLKE